MVSHFWFGIIYEYFITLILMLICVMLMGLENVSIIKRLYSPFGNISNHVHMIEIDNVSDQNCT